MLTNSGESPSSANTSQPAPGARLALILLLAINLFNYIDRQVLSAVLPKLELDASLFSPSDPWLKTKLGSLTTGFMFSYMLLSPIFGWFADRGSRWFVIGAAILLWSLASGGSGLAPTFLVLLLTRCCVGVGEAAYGPVAPSMLSDMYPENHRGRILSYFYLAIPVGSALGFVIGGQVSEMTEWGWRAPFVCVMVPGLILGALALMMRERRPARAANAVSHGYFEVVRTVLKVRSWTIDTAALICTTFVLGGVAAWVPSYVFEREARFEITAKAVQKLADQRASDKVTPLVPAEVIAKLGESESSEVLDMGGLKSKLMAKLSKEELEQYNSRIFDALVTPGSPTTGSIGVIFGGIVVISGLTATLAGGLLGDWLRKRHSGAYFIVSGVGALASVPFFLGMLLLPFPYAWVSTFFAVFGLFLNTGPGNTILANVVPVEIRATSFAINILLIHALGDAVSPLLIGTIADRSSLQVGFLLCTILILVAGVVWLFGAKHLQRDTDAAPTLLTGKRVL
jgi:MFS transporter, Spinster family, sphingosine-1-phosphate transporter